jgi:hypothetical protein
MVTNVWSDGGSLDGKEGELKDDDRKEVEEEVSFDCCLELIASTSMCTNNA